MYAAVSPFRVARLAVSAAPARSMPNVGSARSLHCSASISVGNRRVPSLDRIGRPRLSQRHPTTFTSQHASGTVRALSLWPFSGRAKEGTSSTLETIQDKAASTADQAKDTFNHATDPVSAASSNAADAIQKASTTAPSPDELAPATSDSLAAAGSEAATTVVDRVNEFAALGLPNVWPPASYAQRGLEWVIQDTSLPWWATIIGATVAIRLLIFPLMVKIQGNNIRLANIQPRMKELMEDVTYAKNAGDMATMQRSVSAVQKLMKDNDANPFRSMIIPLVQFPMFMTMFFAIRGMANVELPSMIDGGVWWFTNLTVPDPYVALPIASAAFTLAVVETGAELGTNAANQNPQAKVMKNIIRVLMLITPWLVMNFPAALHLFWTTNSLISLIQFGVLRTPFIRRTFNIPEKVEHPKEVVFDTKKKGGGGFMEGFRLGSNYTEAANQAAYARPARPASVSSVIKQTQASASGGRDAALRQLQSSAPSTTGAAADAAVASGLGHSRGGEVQDAISDHIRSQKESLKSKRVQAARDRRTQRRRI